MAFYIKQLKFIYVFCKKQFYNIVASYINQFMRKNAFSAEIKH